MPKKVLAALGVLCFIVILIGLAGVATAPRFGWHVTMVGGGSMEPTISAGSMAVVRPVDTRDVIAGDIIMFAPPSSSATMTIHRVVDVLTEGGTLQFHTQGDANKNPDPYLVPAQNVRGRLWISMPHLGYLLDYVNTPLGRSIILGVPALLLVAYELRNIYIAIKARRRRPNKRRLVRATRTTVKTAHRTAARVQRS